MYKFEPLYLAATFVDHNNHATDDRQIYINGRGFELYGRYTIKSRYRAVVGYNYLLPKSRPDGGGYILRVGFLGFQYALGDATFRDVVFAHVLLDTTRRFDGSQPGNTFVVGFRWSIDI